MINYGFTKTLDMPFEDAEAHVTAELKKEGFGILTRIDAREKFKEKLDIDFRNYVILGACNPKLAHQAIEAEENIGLFLPCNAILFEKDGKTVVSIIKPAAMMAMINNPALNEVAEIVETKLRQVYDKL